MKYFQVNTSTTSTITITRCLGDVRERQVDASVLGEDVVVNHAIDGGWLGSEVKVLELDFALADLVICTAFAHVSEHIY